MNMRASEWVDIGSVADIPRRGARCVKTGAGRLAVFRTVDDQVYVLEDRCPHRNGPLSQGIVHDASVTCPLHNWVITLKTGEVQGPDEGRVVTVPARIEAGRILIELPVAAGQAA